MREQHSSRPWLTILLAVVNTVIFVLMWRQASYGSLSNPLLLDWGANFAPYTLTGQPWRLLTSAFLHGSWVHLALNMYMLVVLGTVLERAGGTLRFGVAYLLSALGGSLLSALWHGYHEVGSTTFAFGVALASSGIRPVVSVGASGALMGLAGAAAAFALQRRRDSAGDAPVAINLGALGQVIAINLGSGFLISGIDQAAHLGGVVVGFIAGWLMYGAGRSMRVAVPLVFAVLGSAAMLFAAQRAGSEELQGWRDATRRDVERDAAKRHAQQQAAAIAEQIRDDEQHRPAPVSAEQAAGTVVPVGKWPYAMVLGASGKRLYVTDNDRNTLVVVDVERHEVVRTITGEPFATGLDGCPGNMCRGRGASGVYVSPDERYAYVASMRENGLARIDLNSGAIVDGVTLGRFPRAIVASASNDRLYVLNSVDDTISVVSLAHWPQVIATLRLGDHDASGVEFGRALSMWLSPDDRRLYAYAMQKGAIVAFDTATNAQVETYPVDADFIQAQPGEKGAGIWVYNKSSVQWRDASSLAVRDSYPVCQESMHSFDGSGDGSLIAVTGYDDKPMRVIKTATRRTVGEFPVAGGVSQVIFAPDHKTLFALGAAGTLSFLRMDRSLDYLQDGGDGEFLCAASVAATDDDSE
ncbi:rhomboid family intramembrane serine protease [Burkholderia ambifaria]|uniref:Rhomboid family protein n=1 Tax=Burkholderia ambifaria (strain ATCC BAA-244 / DSM 16087 / CCUG 44356 / LMG 19182 / AMMD) TaxID=339670 RepID=Q0BFK1_BURCM|nr:rhomboid family intramembrane serine protease [Burkholderia ambifaria]ABI87072.1 Rhomboid family protein [Burkholderia ambifaria AMMD]MBR7928563.1 rhomboid family intramembrane serine protease [Burkholderia ambifaria]PEH65689.1 rhomboid family intramembrane serine protease [Burkholderia ambifaria]QQC05698.1 rhomboid family intramembrane serine protease [Burkholderia ambifaria]UZU06624.1 rhomboid family intramembrane serine protease [Burkholderia ambifaria]